MPLGNLAEDAPVTIFRSGEVAGLELHKFKQTMGLARVRRVFDLLRSLAPADLLDIGSGRGGELLLQSQRFRVVPIWEIRGKMKNAKW
jgi:hypothetical protein